MAIGREQNYLGSLPTGSSDQGSSFAFSNRSDQTLAQCPLHRQLVECSLHDTKDWDNAKRTTRIQQALNEGRCDGMTRALKEEGFRTFHTRVGYSHSREPGTLDREALISPFLRTSFIDNIATPGRSHHHFLSFQTAPP